MLEGSLFWILVAAISVIACAVLLLPLLRRTAGKPLEDENLTFHRAQIDELNRDLERGLITGEEHAVAEAEIGRRILSASNTASKEGKAGNPARWIAAAIIPLLLAVTFSTYIFVGSPGVTSQPFANRTDPAGIEYRAMLDLATQLEQRIAQDPSDQETLIALAETRGRLQQYAAAASLYGRAAMAANDDPAAQSGLLSAFAEMTILSEDGVISDRAKAAIDEALRLNPREPRARFYRGAWLADQGDLAAALQTWRSLERDSVEGAPWLSNLRRRIAGLEAAIASNGGTVGPAEGSVAPALDPETMAAMASLSEEEQSEQIEQMVDRLRQRMEGSPEDLDGWLRLARAYQVLGRQDDAVAALESASAQVSDRAADLDALLRGFMTIADPQQGIPQSASIIAGRLYQLDPTNRGALWTLANSAISAGDASAARGFLKQLLAQLPEGSPDSLQVQQLIGSLSEE